MLVWVVYFKTLQCYWCFYRTLFTILNIMNATKLNDIESLFEQNSYRPSNKNSKCLEITHDLDATKALIRVERLVNDIINHKGNALFTLTETRNGLKQIQQSLLANKIINILRYSIDLINLSFPIHEFNPYLQVFFRHASNEELIKYVKQLTDPLIKKKTCYSDVEFNEFMRLVTAIEELVAKIQHDVQQLEFKKVVYGSRRLAKKNYNGLVAYIDSLFDRYSRLIVIRVDFSYRMGNAIKTKAEINEKYLEARKDFQHFLNNTKSNSLFCHLLGYVWKLEYGAEKGFHYHLMFFFNGSKLRKDEKIAMLIGEYWKHNITQGRGIYYNCNANKQLYRSLGIGMIHYNDTALRNGLCKAAEYLVKVDHYARLLTPDHARTFGRGEILPNKEKKGRPRLIGNSDVD